MVHTQNEVINIFLWDEVPDSRCMKSSLPVNIYSGKFRKALRWSISYACSIGFKSGDRWAIQNRNIMLLQPMSNSSYSSCMRADISVKFWPICSQCGRTTGTSTSSRYFVVKLPYTQMRSVLPPRHIPTHTIMVPTWNGWTSLGFRRRLTLPGVRQIDILRVSGWKPNRDSSEKNTLNHWQSFYKSQRQMFIYPS